MNHEQREDTENINNHEIITSSSSAAAAAFGIKQHQQSNAAKTTNTTNNNATTIITNHNNNNTNNDHMHCLVCYTDFRSNSNSSNAATSNNCIAIVPCDHNEICSMCHLRLRYLHNDKRCPICKTIHEQIICDKYQIKKMKTNKIITIPTNSDQEEKNSSSNSSSSTSTTMTTTTILQIKKFHEYPIWGDSLGSDYIYDNDVGMFFPIDYYNNIIKPLFGYHCTVPNCTYNNNNNNNDDHNERMDIAATTTTTNTTTTNNAANTNTNNNTRTDNSILPSLTVNPVSNNNNNNNNNNVNTPLRQLIEHLNTAHKLALCNLCIDNKRDFVAKLPRYSPQGLKKHMTIGDGKSFKGHPACQFCVPTRFYDLTALHVHLQKEHYKCHVCELQNIFNQYYKDYKSLEYHFDKKHYLCKNVQCLLARFIVFNNELDLIHHERQVHGITSSNQGDSKIQLQFRVRGSHGIIDSSIVPPDENDFNYGLDGQAFVPPSLPSQNQNNNNNSSSISHSSTMMNDPSSLLLHPLHVQRTEELRQQAANLRLHNEEEENRNAFPSLLETTTATMNNAVANNNTNNTRLTVGWSGGQHSTSNAANVIVRAITQQQRREHGIVTEEEFPSLLVPSSSSSSKNNNNTNKKINSNNNSGGNNASSGTGWMSAVAAITTTPIPSNQPYSAKPVKQQQQAQQKQFLSAPSLNSVDEFPSLSSSGRKSAPANTTTSKGPVRYAAAEALGKQIAAASTTTTTAMKLNNTNNNNDFPALSRSSPTSTKQMVSAANALAPKNPVRAPAIDNIADFPLPPINLLSATTTAATTATMHQITVDEMKAILGSTKYKTLKRHTKDFASSNLDATIYIEYCAALFDYSGYADINFWKMIPNLIESCPSTHNKVLAQQYLNQILQQNANARTAYEAAIRELTIQHEKEQQNIQQKQKTKLVELFPNAIQLQHRQQSVPSNNTFATTSTSSKATTTTQSWNNTTSINTKIKAPPQQQQQQQRVAKKSSTNAWGTSTNTAPVAQRLQQQQPTLASLAAQPTNQSATKFMAKQAKEEKWQQQQKQQQSGNSNTGGNKKKNNNNKQKNELRNLAFGI